MKKVFNSLFVIIAAMVTLAGCAKQEIGAPATVETKTVQFFAESIETKTAFGTPEGTTYPTLWTANDKSVKILLNLNEEIGADITSISDDFTKMEFNANVEIKEDGGSSAPYTFSVISPGAAYLGKNDVRFGVTIPTTQTPTENSVDEAAQILYAVSESFDELPESVSLNFKHFTAYGKLSFINLNLGDAIVTSIDVTSSVNFANRWNYYLEDGRFEENSGANTVTIKTTATENIWFACAPVGEMSGKTLTFTINTNKGPLSKKVTLAEKHKFEAGRIASMKVDMAGIDIDESKVYELVNDVAELTVGSEVIIVASDSNQALSTTQNGNNRGQASVTKSGDKSTITDPATAVQVITVEEGKVDGTFAFNVGSGYLYAASSGSNYLRTEATLSDNSSWKVEIAGGKATIKAQGSNTKNWLRYNSNNSIFSCYGSGQSDVSIYKLRGSGTVKENYLEVSTNAIEVAANATIASFTVKSDLDWTATSDDVTVTTDGNVVNITFEENESEEEQIYTVTVSANGAADQVVTITQGGKIDAVIENGKYWIVASNKVAKPLSGNYGYLNVDDAWTSNDGYSSLEAYAFTFTAVNGGYTIQDASGKYYYMKDSYDSFNVDATAPTDGSHIWTVITDDNGSYTVKNNLKGKYIQYSTPNTSFGSYSTAKGVLPTLVKVQTPVVDLSSMPLSLSFEAEAGSQTITLPANVTVVPSTDNEAFKATASANVVTVTVNAVTVAQTGTLSLAISYNGYSIKKTVTLSQKAPIVEGGNGPYNEMFSTYKNTSTTNTVKVTINGDACSWSGVGVTTAYWNNFTWGSYNTGVTFLKPASKDAVYLESEVLSGGVSNLSVAAAANNTSASIQVSIINVDNNNLETVLGTVKTTSKKTKFTGSWTITGVTGKYKIKITNNSTAAYVNVTDINWD